LKQGGAADPGSGGDALTKLPDRLINKFIPKKQLFTKEGFL
jgi:hypothetical protein